MRVAGRWCSEPLRSYQLAAWIAMTVSSASAKVGTALAERRGSLPRAISRPLAHRNRRPRVPTRRGHFCFALTSESAALCSRCPPGQTVGPTPERPRGDMAPSCGRRWGQSTTKAGMRAHEGHVRLRSARGDPPRPQRGVHGLRSSPRPALHRRDDGHAGADPCCMVDVSAEDRIPRDPHARDNMGELATGRRETAKGVWCRRSRRG